MPQGRAKTVILPAATACLAALLLAGTGLAAEPLPAAPDYFLHTWQTDDGLPQNSVTAITQTRDGYLWLSTYNGLARFDGVRFKVFDSSTTPELKSSQITSLFQDAAGILWIGHETGDLTRFEAGTFAAVEIPGGWTGGPIAGLRTDESGDLWIHNPEGRLARVKDGLVIAPSVGTGNPVGAVAMAKDRQGRLWVARSGELGRLHQGRFVPAKLENNPGSGYVQQIAPSRDGGLWILVDSHLRKWKDEKWVEDFGPCAEGASSVTALLETRSGCVVAGTLDQGVYLLRPGLPWLHFSRTNGLPQDWVRCLAEDSEGNVWLGAGSGGLSALRASKVVTVNGPDRWQDRVVLSVSAGHGGRLWVGTEGAGLYRLVGDRWTHFGEAEGVSNLFVWSAAEDAAGKLWVGTWGGGLLVQRGERFQPAPGLAGVTTPMPALLHGRHGELWVGTTSGLLRYEAGHAVGFGREQGLQLPDVRCIAEDREGTVWFGMSGGGLGRLKDGALKQFRKHDGLASDFILSLHEDADGALWIGTFGGGLNRLKQGRFSTVAPHQGLPNGTITQLEDDGLGNFWVGSHGGIFRVSKDALNRCADGKIASVQCLTYGKGEGLASLECSGGLQPAGGRTDDGRLWFPTRQGLVAVDPFNVKTNPSPPPVVIEEVLSGDRTIVDGAALARISAAAPLKIPAGQGRLEFRYTGLSFTVPEKVRFKCRLEGLEPDWVEAGTKRSAPYTYLPPGNYTFRVIACNNDGVWNPSGAALAFTVVPRFWQTWWFRILAGLGSGLAIAAAVHWEARRRLRRKLDRIERQQAVERERARIAKDIHDDLGASLTRITLLSQSARSELDQPEQAAANLDRIYQTARELTRAMDEIVWAVNPQHDTLDSLATYLGRFAQDFLSAAGIRCRLDVPLQLPALPLTAEVRHNLFLAFKESLHNAVKHAAASEVRISLTLRPNAFALVVEDNGRGFAPRPEPAAPGNDFARLAPGNGLSNMRRRLEEIGGQCEIESEPGQGTRVKFRVSIRLPRP